MKPMYFHAAPAYNAAREDEKALYAAIPDGLIPILRPLIRNLTIDYKYIGRIEETCETMYKQKEVSA